MVPRRTFPAETPRRRTTVTMIAAGISLGRPRDGPREKAATPAGLSRRRRLLQGPTIRGTYRVQTVLRSRAKAATARTGRSSRAPGTDSRATAAQVTGKRETV